MIEGYVGEDPNNPDELTETERDDLESPIYQQASDVDICRAADAGDPVADEIFDSWSQDRRSAAIEAVDKGVGA